MQEVVERRRAAFAERLRRVRIVHAAAAAQPTGAVRLERIEAARARRLAHSSTVVIALAIGATALQ